MKNNWNLLDLDENETMHRLGVSHLVGKVLSASTLTSEQEEELLHGEAVLHTSKAECVRRCAERIMLAKTRNEKVFIGGDYDTDGITATAILKDTLDQLGIQNGYYIPDRFQEGYGLKPETVEAVVQKGYQLIITVDNGVRAFEAIAKAKECNVEIIITDHHEISAEVQADLLVHPSLMEPEYATLSGAGVALQISRTLLNENRNHTALAAIAAIADVMPLWKETRVIVKNGLAFLRQGALPPVQSLLYPGAAMNVKTLQFQVIPKLNSVGRMNDISNVNTLVSFLLLTDPTAISRFAVQLNQVNQARKALSNRMNKQAEQLLDESAFQVIYQPDFAEGVCGLVAGRIANTIHKPTLVLADNEDTIKGSGRSVSGFDLYGFFHEGFEDLFEAFGGHEMAVGLSIKKENLERFRERIATKMATLEFHYEEPVQNALLIHSDLLSLDEIASLDQLEPYPKELIEPIFAVQNPDVIQNRNTGKVVKYTCDAASGTYDAVMYSYTGLKPLESVTLWIGTLSINRWRNLITPQIELLDLDGE